MRRFALLLGRITAVLFLMTGAAGWFVPAYPQQSGFDQANELMEEYRFGEALASYRSIEQEGFHSGKLYYNMAVAAIQQDSLGLAKYYLLQSVQFEETRTEAEQALGFINEQFDRRSAVLPKLPWQRLYEWLEDRIGSLALMLAGLLLLNLGVGGIIGSWFVRTAPKQLKIGGYTALAGSILLIAASLYIQYMDNRYDTAVVVTRTDSVHETATSSSAPVSRAYEGYVLTVDNKTSEDREGWYYVRLENGLYGWIEESSVKKF